MEIIPTGKLFMALTSHAFKPPIFDWLSTVHDCYVLQSRSSHEALQIFDTFNVLKMNIECVDNLKAAQCEHQNSQNKCDANGGHKVCELFNSDFGMFRS